MFDLGFRGKKSFALGAILLTVECDGAHVQLHYVNICVKMCFRNLVTTTVRQQLRLKWFLNM